MYIYSEDSFSIIFHSIQCNNNDLFQRRMTTNVRIIYFFIKHLTVKCKI